jgi:hypothetical protein
MFVEYLIDRVTNFFLKCLFAGEQKRAKVEGTKCHGKTMMSIKADETIKENPSMCHKDEGGG